MELFEYSKLIENVRIAFSINFVGFMLNFIPAYKKKNELRRTNRRPFY
jgi:hypothetical protein